jgi:hypothetical protein
MGFTAGTAPSVGQLGLGHPAPAGSSDFVAGSLEALSKGFADISSSDDRYFLLHGCNSGAVDRGSIGTDSVVH